MTLRFRRLLLVAVATLLAAAPSVSGQAPAQAPRVAQAIADLYATQPNYNPATGTGGLTAESHFISSGPGPGIFTGININNFLGANRFYSAGYTVTGVTVVASLPSNVTVVSYIPRSSSRTAPCRLTSRVPTAMHRSNQEPRSVDSRTRCGQLHRNQKQMRGPPWVGPSFKQV